MITQYTNGTNYIVELKDNNGYIHKVQPNSSINIFLITGLKSNPIGVHFVKYKYPEMGTGFRKIVGRIYN